MNQMTRAGAAAFAIALPLTLLSAGGPAQAAEGLIAFQYRATIDATAAGSASDAPVTITFFYEPDAAVLDSSPTFATYEQLRYTAEIAGECLSLSAGSGNSFSVFNNAGTTFVEDSFDASAHEPSTDGSSMFGLNAEGIQLVLIDPDRTMFDSTAAPQTIEDFDGADLSQIVFQLRNTDTDQRVTLFQQTEDFSLSTYDPDADVRDLQDTVAGLPGGIRNGMEAQLDRALGFLADTDPTNDRRADTALDAFVRMVDAAETSGQIDAGTTAQLRDGAALATGKTPGC